MKKIHPEFPWLSIIGLFAILCVCLTIGVTSYLHAIQSLVPDYHNHPNTPEGNEAYHQKVAIRLLQASSNYYGFIHLVGFLSATFMLGLGFKRCPQKWQQYVIFVVSLVIFSIAAYFFFQAETYADILPDSSKADYFTQIVFAKLASLLAATFSGGFSFEMGKSCFLESE